MNLRNRNFPSTFHVRDESRHQSGNVPSDELTLFSLRLTAAATRFAVRRQMGD
ncbi:hypothetical protein X760_21905 [Mesorhizobium sp. LSHC422A00]|nr:hypothetical protein X767_28530 [Mesorhizobium sp. LSJC264A00]ESX58087.1 hypothetical protein X760_21905 [Mesorhizobium sp. LSHC422A00]ESZ24595.1 hypothetical protein X733_31945 [Mesorhizobium sp. L2C067A000]